jgi:hypothetical protein
VAPVVQQVIVSTVHNHTTAVEGPRLREAGGKDMMPHGRCALPVTADLVVGRGRLGVGRCQEI